MFQHDAIHIQHGDNDERKSEHPFLVSPETWYVQLHGEESDQFG